MCNSCNVLQCHVCRPPVCHASCRPSFSGSGGIGKLLTWVTPVFVLVCVCSTWDPPCAMQGVGHRVGKHTRVVYIYNKTTNSWQRTTELSQLTINNLRHKCKINTLKVFLKWDTKRNTKLHTFLLKSFLVFLPLKRGGGGVVRGEFDFHIQRRDDGDP